MLREAEIVVAREIQEALAVDRDVRTIGCFDRAQASHQRSANACGLPGSEAIEERQTRHVLL
jgi:hypothetical protein